MTPIRPKLGRVIVALALLMQPATPFAAKLPGKISLTLPGVTGVNPGAVKVPPQLKAPLTPETSLALPDKIVPPVHLPEALTPEVAPAAHAEPVKGVLPQLLRTAQTISGARSAESAAAANAEQSEGFVAAQESFDGKQSEREGSFWAMTPDFDPPMSERKPPLMRSIDDEDGGKENDLRPDDDRPTLSFPQSIKNSLLAIDPAKAIYGVVKVIRETSKRPGERRNGSEKYWTQYRKGVAINVMVGNENVFGRTAKITYAVTKSISRLTREDFRGIVPAFQLQLPIRELRQKLIERLDENRAFWHRQDPPVSGDTRVRLVKFQSYIQLYKEAHGKSAVPEPEPAVERKPLTLKPEGKLEGLSRFPPRVIFLDIDSIDKPLSRETLADMAELQRTGVYFVAFSRRPYNAPDGMHDMLVRNMSGSQLTAQMPNRFLAVTDDGAVISKFRKDGAVVPVESLSFMPQDIDVIRDAAHKGFEKMRIPPRTVKEQKQPPIFIAGQRFNPFARKTTAELNDPHVRYELIFPRDTNEEVLANWRADFQRRVSDQGIFIVDDLRRLADGRFSYSIRKTELARSFDRLYRALGDEFGLYATPSKSDIIVLSLDPKLREINSLLDLSRVTTLQGTELVENLLGLVLGEARKGGKKGSASRMIQFSGYRERYMSEFLVAQDAAEQNINFFSGHMVHAANDWLVSQLQHGKIPTVTEYEGHLRERWNRGIREIKPIGIPKGQRMERLLNASVTRGRKMYEYVTAAHERGEILIGTEIPNFIVIEDYKRGKDGKLKERYIVHTIFDLIALRPDPNNPGHATLVTYDFKTGPAKSVQKLQKDDQVRTYSLFNYERWVGRPFPVPYLSGEESYVIDDAVIEFVYNLVVKPEITSYDREKQRGRIIRVFNAIHNTEQKLLGVTANGKPARIVKSKKAKGLKPKAKELIRKNK